MSQQEMHKRRVQSRSQVLALAVSLALLGGCSIQPKPLDSVAEAQRIRQEIESLFTAQAPIDQPISLDEAMARAIKYNLDHRVKLMERALAHGQLEVARYEMLPELTAEAGYHDRSNINGSSSNDVNNLDVALVDFSSSQESQRNTRGVGFVWNLLDFGVSYAQAEQQADQTLISEEKRRKVIQNIIQDVRYAYWRALSAQQLLPWMEQITERLDDALKRVNALQDLNILPPLVHLNYRRELLDTRLQMWQVREQLLSARAELAALINIQPGVEFHLTEVDSDQLEVPEFDLPIEVLENAALINRPEVHEEAYQRRISTTEIRKAMLRMLPGLEIELGANYDSNRFLYNNSWNELGLRVSWNVFNLFTGPTNRRAAEAQVEVDEARSLALGMAVITQIHLARLRYQTALEDYRGSAELASVEDSIFRFTRDGQKADIQDELQVIRSEADSLLARMNQHLSYAELQNAYGRIQNSVGIDPLPATLEDHELATIADELGRRMESWPQLVMESSVELRSGSTSPEH